MKYFTTKNRYLSRGVNADICLSLQITMWYMIQNMKVEQKDYLQVFNLKPVEKGDELYQQITHTQEEPDYKEEVCVKLFEEDIVDTKVYVIDDGDYCTMLLAEEY